MQLIASREYKLILNNDRFQDREQGCQALGELIQFLVQEYGGEITKKQNQPNDEEFRKTWYIDTAELALQQSRFILRIREEDHGSKYKTTLKYRSSDRYISASQEINPPGIDAKFEEDITPPFVNKFSKSASVKTLEQPVFRTIADISQQFPNLRKLGLAEALPVGIVNHFIADEIFRKAGQIKFADQDPILKTAFSFWYLPHSAGTYPLISEFSFSYEVENEDFPIAVVEAANNFFAALQKQSGWFDQTNDTKTAYAYSAL